MDFIGPSVTIVSCPAKMESQSVLEERDTWVSDEATIARLRAENPHLVQYKAEWFWKRDRERE